MTELENFLNALKPILFQLANSHSKLAQAEYQRNPLYNETHFSHIAECDLLDFLKGWGMLDEFMMWRIKNENN